MQHGQFGIWAMKSTKILYGKLTWQQEDWDTQIYAVLIYTSSNSRPLKLFFSSCIVAVIDGSSAAESQIQYKKFPQITVYSISKETLQIFSLPARKIEYQTNFPVENKAEVALRKMKKEWRQLPQNARNKN